MCPQRVVTAGVRAQNAAVVRDMVSPLTQCAARSPQMTAAAAGQPVVLVQTSAAAVARPSFSFSACVLEPARLGSKTTVKHPADPALRPSPRPPARPDPLAVVLFSRSGIEPGRIPHRPPDAVGTFLRIVMVNDVCQCQEPPPIPARLPTRVPLAPPASPKS